MRMKALGVALMVGFAAFTTFYWIADSALRASSETRREEELLEFGQLIFLPDDTYTVNEEITEAGFADPQLTVFVNTSLNFENKTGAEITVSGSGARPFEVVIADERSSPVKFDTEGQTTITASGVEGNLVITANPPHLVPYGANCARCHGIDGRGGAVPGLEGVFAPDLHSAILADKWLRTGGAQGLNNYVQWVITLGGVVRSGSIDSPMPAWGLEYGGSLTRQQIEAVTALIGSWLEETVANPPPEDVPDTVEAGAQVYAEAGCAGCHGVNLEGGVGPNLQTIGSALVTDLPVPVAHLDQMQADYDADPRAFLEAWIRDSSTNYNDGNATQMPAFPESQLSASRLRALITFLLAQTE